VTHPTTPVVWRNCTWIELQHSEHTGHPYHTRRQVEVYPTPNFEAMTEDNADELVTDLTNLQIRSALAIIDPNSPGSPHRPRSIKLRTSTGANELTNASSCSTMSTQTITAIVTAEAWYQLGRLVRCDGERDVSAQSLGQAQL
jgi:hypothetical protein